MHDASYYEKLGFKCGLEIHQRLATREKLFCSCSATMGDDAPITAQIERMQRAVAGELGNIDTSTKFESGRERTFLYDTYQTTTCLVDVDEEPPHELNKEALEIALLVSATFGAEVPDEIEPMRKEVVDGSDPSAFQRTMQVGFNGYLEIGKKKINVPSIFLEEEASGIVTTQDSIVTYSVDRLGIPLVEIDTDPTISTPQEAKETAYKIGMLLRLTGRVQRGIGSIRQDVNLSIRGGARVELKGFQELDIMDAAIENEVDRQINLIKIKEELEKRHAKVHKEVNLTDIFANTNSHLIKENTKNKGAVYGVRLEGFGGIIGTEINPNRRLGTEISDYAKIMGIKGIIHSDEKLESYTFSEHEISEIKKKLEIKEKDAFMLVAGEAIAAERAIERAIIRAAMAIREVPRETRYVDSKTLTTRFLRLIPGGSRMYPETDAIPVTVDQKKFEKLKELIPNLEKTQSELDKQIGNKQLAGQMIKSPYLQAFYIISSAVKGVDQKFLAAFLLERMKEMRRQGIDIDEIPEEVLVTTFDKLTKNEITKIGVEEIIKSLPEKKSDVDAVIKRKGLERITGKKLKDLISGFHEKDKGNMIKAIMSKHRANIDGDELNSILK